MSTPPDTGRLNVLVELLSECIGITDPEALLKVTAERLRWVIQYDRCTFVVVRAEERVCWTASGVDQTLRRALFTDLPEAEVASIERVLETGAPAAESPSSMCVPLAVGGRVLGAISFWSSTGPYGYRDLRLAHLAGQYLGSLVSRLELEEETRRLSAHKDDVLALLGHEIRNPLAPIMTAIHVLKARPGGQSSRELDVIDRQARHLVRLIDDLLDVARLTRGKVVLQRAPVEMAHVVARAAEMVAPLLEQRGHTLTVDVPSGLVVDGDESRLAQVLSNLLSNAAHYTEPGGHVRIAARHEGRAVAIAVADDGIGISRDTLPGVFVPFVQGSRRSSEQGGLGLGLAIVKQLTELHGGSVSVASGGAGSGTTFTVRLPLAPPEARTTAPATEPTAIAPARAAQRILLVDDNEDALEMLSVLLETAGHEVATAADGPRALDMLARCRPSVLVVDINMPVMDGYEVAARIRAHEGAEHHYLVALTGYGQATDRERSRAAGFDEHLVKPVEFNALLQALDRAAGRAANRRSP